LRVQGTRIGLEIKVEKTKSPRLEISEGEVLMMKEMSFQFRTIMDFARIARTDVSETESSEITFPVSFKLTSTFHPVRFVPKIQKLQV